MPHHAVKRESSTTTKVRVVFNASSKSDNGHSLNDWLMTGPTIQADVFTHLIRFRMYHVALTGDLTKMYRQINVHPSDQHLQLIYWREKTDCPISEFKLTTVTYGTTSAPFQAIRTLKQLAQDERKHFPTASVVLENNFYVDDLLTGTHKPEDTANLKSNLTELLQKGGFDITKWCSNNNLVVSHEVGLPDVLLQ